MIRVYTGDVYSIKNGEYDRDELLVFFLNGHRDNYISIYEDDKLTGVISYEDVLYRRNVSNNIFIIDENIFYNASVLFDSYDNKHNGCAGAVNENGELECILYYEANIQNTAMHVDEFNLINLEKILNSDNLDTDIFNRADTFVFDELEEYSYYSARVILDKLRNKKVIFTDSEASAFFKNSDGVQIVDKSEISELSGKVMRISGKKPHRNGAFIRRDLYYSIDLMESMLWQTRVKHFGKNEPDKRFLLIHFPLYSSGLGDVIRACMSWVAVNEIRSLGYIPVIALNVKNDQNQFTGGNGTNVWNLFFEPVSKYDPEYVKTCANVLEISYKLETSNIYFMQMFLENKENMQGICAKYLRFNNQVKENINKIINDTLKNINIRVMDKSGMLAVVARGTDFKSGKYGVPVPMDIDMYIQKVIDDLERLNCSYVVLATEDKEYLDKFKQNIPEEQLIYVNQERYDYSTSSNKDKLIASIKSEKHDYRDEIPYLAVLYMLSECDSIISNCDCGAYQIAQYLNGGKFRSNECYGSFKY